MENRILTVLSNKRLTGDVYEMRLCTDCEPTCADIGRIGSTGDVSDITKACDTGKIDGGKAHGSDIGAGICDSLNDCGIDGARKEIVSDCGKNAATDIAGGFCDGDDIRRIEDEIKPGQFINIKLDGFYLRRPISICDFGKGFVKIIYKTVGHGTEKLSMTKEGETLDVLLPLGNGYDMSKSGERPLLLGGGVGVPPLYGLCKRLTEEGKRVSVVLGFGTDSEIFYEDEFRALGADVRVTTVDGSRGTKGFVTDALPEDYTYFYTCGPEPMLRAVYNLTKTSGQLSFEERMGCGFGACMGCSCKTKYGYKRICRDGPVLEKEEIIW